MKSKNVLLGVCMVGTVFNSAALTLGRIRGAAWIGEPLSLSVPVQLEPGLSDTGLCAEADVFYADFQQDPSRVRVQQEPSPQGDLRILQVYSAPSVNEPMVTVYLRVGCEQKIARRYVLLADFPSTADSALPMAAPASDAPTRTPPAPAVARALQTADDTVDNPVGSRRTAPLPAPPDRQAKPATQHPPPTARAVAPIATPPKPAPASPARARLRLDPLENLTERIKTLETTTTSIPLDELVRDAQRMQQLQRDVNALLQQAAKNEASLTAMRERLEKAESERVSAILIYGLAALLSLCLAAIVILWSRRNPHAVWRQEWPEPQVGESRHPVDATATETPTVAHPAPPPATPIAQKETIAPTVAALDVNLIEMDSASYGELMHPTPTGPAALDALEPVPQPLLPSLLPHQNFNADSQFDLRQQAEFFERLEKTDEAIELLEQRIHSNSKDCPLVYLELLRIANAHSLKTDFRQFSDECQQVFNVNIPEFALFRNEGKGLDASPTLLAHIEKLWPSAQTLDVLESCILRDPWEKNASPFDLAAFKELVLLHGVVHRLNYPAKATPSQSQHVDIDL